MSEGTDTVATLRRDDLPELHRIASATSAAGQRETVRLTQLQLLCVIGSAAADAAGGDHGWRRAAFAVAALLFAGSLGAALIQGYGGTQRRWFGGRAAAESVKTLVWRYAMRASPFDDAASAPDEVFLARLRDVLGALTRIELTFDAVDVRAGTPGYLSPAVRALRAQPIEARRVAYLTGRLQPEIAWYSGKAIAARRDAKRWTALAVLAAAIGLAGSIGRLYGLTLDVLGVAAAAMAATAAWTQLRQYGQLANSYFLTSVDLRLVLGEADAARDEQQWARFVEQAESAISREHTLWLARRN